MGSSFSSPRRGSTTNDNSSDEPEEQQPATNYATVAEASVAYAEEAKVKAEQQTSNSSPRRVKKEDAGVPLPSLNGLTAGRRKRTQTDFLSPTFTPQKRVKREDGTAAAVKTETSGEEETTPSRYGTHAFFG